MAKWTPLQRPNHNLSNAAEKAMSAAPTHLSADSGEVEKGLVIEQSDWPVS